MNGRKLVSPIIIGQGDTGTIALQGDTRLLARSHVVCDHVKQCRLTRATIATHNSDVPLDGKCVLSSPAAGNLNEMRTVHKQYLQIRNRLVNQFGHVVNDSAAIHDFNFKILATKVHHMIEIHNELAVFRHVKNPLGTVVTTGRGVKNMLTIKSHKQQRFHATRKLEWGDGSKHGAFDDVFGDNIRSIDIFNYRDCIGIRNPSRPVRVFEICRCVVNRFWHIAKVDA